MKSYPPPPQNPRPPPPQPQVLPLVVVPVVPHVVVLIQVIPPPDHMTVVKASPESKLASTSVLSPVIETVFVRTVHDEVTKSSTFACIIIFLSV